MEKIGLELKNARIAKKMSLEDIANKTNIKSDYLIAIEEDKLENLPALVYAKGFVKTYANYLGFDGLDFSKRFFENNKMPVKEIIVEKKKEKNKLEYDFFLRYRRPIFIFIISIVVFFCLYKLVSVAGNFFKSRSKQITVTEEIPVVVSQPKEVEAVKEEEVTKRETRDFVIKDAYLQLKAIAQNNVWIIVIADGDTVFEGVLKENTEENWKAKKTIVLKIANAGNVKFILNEMDLGKLGKQGEVIKNITITKKGLEFNP